MDFVKKNLIMIISAAVAVLALVLIFLGISHISGVRDVMAESQQQLSSVESLGRGIPIPKPDGGNVNLIPTEAKVNQVQGVAAQAKAKGCKLLEVELKDNIGYDAKTGNFKRKPLLDGIFPKPVNAAQPYQFRTAYKTGLNRILEIMQAGTVPSAEDLQTSEEKMAQDMGFLMEELMAETKKKASTDRSGRNQGPTPEEQLKTLAVDMAATQRASGIKVYCGINNLDIIQGLDVASGTAPSVDEMWWGQLSVWIQEDIAGAVAQVNAQAKDVTESVVKRIMSIEVMHGYFLPDGYIGRQEAVKLQNSFTGVKSNENYDVIRFGITTVIDARRIPEFIDAMYKQGHYTLYFWSIEELDTSSTNQRGYNQVDENSLYRYGTAPLVKLTTEWEGYLLRDFYHWGVVGYDVNRETGKPILILYTGKRQEIEDMGKRENLEGLMPKAIRDALSDDSENKSSGEFGGSGQFGF